MRYFSVIHCSCIPKIHPENINIIRVNCLDRTTRHRLFSPNCFESDVAFQASPTAKVAIIWMVFTEMMRASWSCLYLHCQLLTLARFTNLSTFYGLKYDEVMFWFDCDWKLLNCHRKPPQQLPTARGGMAFWRLTANLWRCWSQPPSSTRSVPVRKDQSCDLKQPLHVCTFSCPCSFWSQCCCWVKSALLELTSESEWRVVDASHKSTVSRNSVINHKYRL